MRAEIELIAKNDEQNDLEEEGAESHNPMMN